MLQLPNLDDQTYEQIVNNARRSIPKLIPQWTDENAHDPGITFIELFAWLTEMQQYYLNRITGRNELKFLKLLGTELKEPVSAKTDVTFDNVSSSTFLPRGTKLLAKEQSFETMDDLLLIPNTVKKVIVRTDSSTNDYTSSNENLGAAYYAFGTEAKKDSRIYIGFDMELPRGEQLSLNLNLFDDYPVPVLPDSSSLGETIFTPSARISWKFYGTEEPTNEQHSDWIPIHVITDGTKYLTESGSIIFTIPSPMTPMIINPANDKRRFWICCTVDEEGYELCPKIEKIYVNTVAAVQQDTQSQYISFDGTGEPNQLIVLNDYLSFYGSNKVQVRDDNGYWRYWNEIVDFNEISKEEYCFSIHKDEVSMKTTISFGSDQHGRTPSLGHDNIRVISYTAEFTQHRLFSRSSGLPNQVHLVNGINIISSSLRLQVGIKALQSKDLIWQDWVRVVDFDTSKSDDRHYLFNPETSEITFGNNEKGLIPNPSDHNNLCLISYQTGGGERGNVKKQILNHIVGDREALRRLTVSNYFFAVGGMERESMENAKLRVQKELKKQYRAVTNKDFEEITKATPGLRVARVKALPLYHPKLKDYPENKAAAQMTIVVVPYSESQKPIPSIGFLETVGRHLDRHRLITTELHIIPPEYIKITVYAIVIVEPHTRNAKQNINEALDALLQPLDNKQGNKGWDFGRTVYKGDIYGVINKIKGISYIQDLWLEFEGVGATKVDNGDIQIPPYGLVYSGIHELSVISRNDI